MDNKNVDRRIRKTKSAPGQGLSLELLEEKVYEGYLPSENYLDRIDINRGTFYLHYKDIYDMVEQIQTEMFKDFHGVLLDKHPSKSLNGKSVCQCLSMYFSLLRENSDMCKVLIR